RWGQVHIVQVGDHWRAYRKPAPVKAGWDDPVWQSHISPNLIGVFLEDSENPPTTQHPLSGAGLLPRARGRCPAGAEGGAPHDTS
ncbi:MAG: hypothetical protein CVT79_14060, partial [Alphaproteobacteria bacterium HGW-Alphaproteobacteria-18]